jgi:hypothetical protein
MAEARLSFEERKTITILIQVFSFLKCIHFFGTLCICTYGMQRHFFTVDGIVKTTMFHEVI